MRLKRFMWVMIVAVTVAPAAAAPMVATDRCTRISAVMVSWYGGKFDGRHTANGETFDKNAMTAASVSLPMGTRVRFTNPTNGRSVDIRINDRGPYAKDGATGKYIVHPQRTFDLSEAAATQLDILKMGTARVHVQLLCG